MNHIRGFTNVRQSIYLLSKEVVVLHRTNSWNINRCKSPPMLCNRRSIYTDKIMLVHERPYVPRRTLMYVPGHDTKKLKKIPGLGADCAVLECEDGVAVNMKSQARKNIREALDYLDPGNYDLALRVNSRVSELMEADLGAVIGDDLGTPADETRLPKTILLPKVDSVDDVVIFADRLRAVKLGRKYSPYLIVYTESAQGLMNMNDVLKKASDLSKEGVFQLDGVVFGSDDFDADIGAVRTNDGREVIYARQKTVMIAKAYRLQAIDMVCVDIKDQEVLRVQSEEGAKMGYTGKQVIHPAQLPTVEAAFTPSKARVEWATELVKGFEEHQNSGKGAFTFHGQMIDMPLLLQAKNVLTIVKNVNKKS